MPPEIAGVATESANRSQAVSISGNARFHSSRFSVIPRGGRHPIQLANDVQANDCLLQLGAHILPFGHHLRPESEKKNAIFNTNINLTHLFLSIDLILIRHLESACPPKPRDNPNPLPSHRPGQFRSKPSPRDPAELIAYQSKRVACRVMLPAAETVRAKA